MAFLDKSTVIYSLITILLAIIYPFFEWRLSLSHYNESKIDNDFNRQIYSVMHRAKLYNQTIESIPIHQITEKNEKQIGFNLLDAQYSAILSNYIYLINHDTFQHSHNPLIKEPLTDHPHNFPFGFNLFYLQLRTENDVNVKWALIENNNTNTVYLVLCGTDFLIDVLIDISFSPLPLTYNPDDIKLSKSWHSIFDHTKTSDLSDNFLVHGGINGCIQWLFSNITTVLDGILTKNKKVIVTGHSLGAGLSTVLTMRMLTLYKRMKELKINIKLYTFGSPFVLSILDKDNERKHSTLDKLNKCTFNFVNRFDIIPRMLGPSFEILYPKFLWNDELLLNQIKTFKPIGKYYILHDKNRILYGIDAATHHILSNQILKIIPKALLSDRSDARTKLVLLIFRFLFGKKYEEYINYLLWISFSAQPLINDHSMDNYLSMLGDFTSHIAFTDDDGTVLCLNSALRFKECDMKYRNKNDKEWRVTQYGQLQNLRTKECIYMDWKLDNIFSWSFKYELTKTYECSTKITRFKYLNKYKIFEIQSDEYIDDYDNVDIDELIGNNNDGVNNNNNGLCLGCDTETKQLDIYRCNESNKDIQTLFYFNPHNIASNGRMKDNPQDNVIIPQWSLSTIFNRFF